MGCRVSNTLVFYPYMWWYVVVHRDDGCALRSEQSSNMMVDCERVNTPMVVQDNACLILHQT